VLQLSEDAENQLERQSFKYGFLNRIRGKEPRFDREIVQHKLALLDMCYKRESGGRNALVILDRKIKGKIAKGRPKRMWFDDIRQWTVLKDYGEVKRSV